MGNPVEANSSALGRVLNIMAEKYLWLFEIEGFRLRDSFIYWPTGDCWVELSGGEMVVRFVSERGAIVLEFLGTPDWKQGVSIDLLSDHFDCGSLPAVIGAAEVDEFVRENFKRVSELLSGRSEYDLGPLLDSLKRRRAKRLFG